MNSPKLKPASTRVALKRLVRRFYSPHACFARRLRKMANDARKERMHPLGSVCDDMAKTLEAQVDLDFPTPTEVRKVKCRTKNKTFRAALAIAQRPPKNRDDQRARPEK